MMGQYIPGLDIHWGLWIWVIAFIAGVMCHSPQSSLSDYYRQIHLFFLKGKEGSELDTYESQIKIYNSLPKRGALFEHLFYYNYANYCKSQEKRSPAFQKMIQVMKEKYGSASNIPADIREEFLEGSRPLMKYTNILTFNTRAICIYVTCLLGCPWVYMLIEITVMNVLYIYMHKKHECLCKKLQKDSMTKGFIFDYGGTIDTAGRHWGKVLWHAYCRHEIPVTEEQFREAYVHAERTLGSQPIIKPDYTFYKTLETKLRIEMEYLMSEGYWNVSEDEYVRSHKDILEDLYEGVRQETSHSREVLTKINAGHPMVLVSNFYGNIGVVLKEFGLDKLFLQIIESAVVGIRKPDPRIFTLGVEALKLNPADVTVVGDSFYKDIVPAKKAGCKTIWFKGEGWTDEKYDETIPDKVITDLSQLL